nr:MAG TPA: hypothetical protein [Caudoviricetes sp.]
MTDDRLIPLELTLDDLTWLRAFLNQERGAAEVDRQKARDLLHTSLATRAAVQVLSREIETMTGIIDEICRLIDANDAHESRARQRAAMTPPVA